MKPLITLIFFFALGLLKPQLAMGQVADVQDSLTLMQLYAETGGPGWTYLNATFLDSHWGTGAVKSWFGVTLNGDGTVSAIDLTINGLSGPFPTAVFNFKNLISLSLGANYLYGPIPPELGELTFLQKLDLGSNQFSGAIPPEIGTMSGLTGLNLSNNPLLTGTIPEQFGNLINLKTFVLIQNNLVDPFPLSMGNLTNLTTFDVSGAFLFNTAVEKIASRMVGPGLFFAFNSTIHPHVSNHNGLLSVTVGGTVSKQRYQWSLNGRFFAEVNGDSTVQTTGNGNYSCTIWDSANLNSMIMGSDTLRYGTLPKVHFVDPNPLYINSYGLIQVNDPTKIDTTKEVIGGATDSVTKILLVATSDIPLSFSIANNQDGFIYNLDGSRNNGLSISPVNHRVVAVYNVPDGYGANYLIGLRSVDIVESDPSDTNKNQTISLQLFPAPVVLVHGMWSNPLVWINGGFTDELSSAGYTLDFSPYKRGYVFLADYRQYNASTFDPFSPASIYGRSAVSSAITTALQSYRNNQIAVTQADVVGHSLGGLMARSFSQQGASFLKSDNYNSGYIHRLITLGTPHKGSALGPAFYDNQNLIALLSKTDPNNFAYTTTINLIMKFISGPIGPCLRDFNENGNVIQKNLRKTPHFQTYSIGGDYTGNSLNVAGYNGLDQLLQLITGKTHADIFHVAGCDPGSEPKSDIIVPLYSQMGGNTIGTVLTGVAHSAPPGQTSETDYKPIQDKVIQLLLSDNPQSFNHKGFPDAFGIMDDCTAPSVTSSFQSVKPVIPNKIQTESIQTLGIHPTNILGNQGPSVKIISPASGYSIANNAASLSLQYQVQNGTVPVNAVFLVQGIGWYAAPLLPPYSLSITIPAHVAIGKTNIALLVKDTSGLLLADTLSIQINPGSSLDSLIAFPKSILLDSTLRTISVNVEGYYVGIGSDITSGTAGTTYAWGKGGIFTIDPNGIVTAAKPGTDTLYISNSGKSVKVPVIVSPNYSIRTIYPNQISFDQITNKTISDNPFMVYATSLSGDPITYSILSGNATIQNGIVTITGSGPVTIGATVAANVYFTGVTATQTFCVNPGQASIIMGDTISCAMQKTYQIRKIPGAIFQWQVSEGGQVSSIDTIAYVNWDTPGIHTLTVTPMAGNCTGIARQITVLVEGVNRPSIIPSGVTHICEGGKVELKNQSSGTVAWYKDNSTVALTNADSIQISQAGNYFAKLNDTLGCTLVSDTVTIVIDSLFIPLINLKSAAILCPDSAILFTTSSGNLQWYLNDNAITGQADSSITITQPGNYSIRKQSPTGCFVNSAVFNVPLNTNNQIPVIEASGSLNLCNGSILTLSSTSETGNFWFKNGNIISQNAGPAYIVSDSGVYTLRINYILGCSPLSLPVSVSLLSIPTPSIRLNNGTLVSSEGSGNQWFLNNSPIQNATDSTLKPLVSGTYSVQVTEDSCQSARSLEFKYNGNSNSLDSLVTINPNPFSDKIYILNNSSGSLRIQLYNLLGQQIATLSVFIGIYEMQTGSLSPGTYFILITDKNGNKISKIMVKE